MGAHVGTVNGKPVVMIEEEYLGNNSRWTIYSLTKGDPDPIQDEPTLRAAKAFAKKWFATATQRIKWDFEEHSFGHAAFGTRHKGYYGGQVVAEIEHYLGGTFGLMPIDELVCDGRYSQFPSWEEGERLYKTLGGAMRAAERLLANSDLAEKVGQ